MRNVAGLLPSIRGSLAPARGRSADRHGVSPRGVIWPAGEARKRGNGLVCVTRPHLARCAATPARTGDDADRAWPD
jgi:hypothetical protein